MAGGPPCEMPLQPQLGQLNDSVVDAIAGCGISSVEEIEDEYICVICTHPCFGGVQTICCEHLLHPRCLQRWLQEKRTRTCPHCRRGLTGEAEPSRPMGRVLRSVISAKRVACPQGCEAEPQWEGLEAHIHSTCPMTPMSCPHEGCDGGAPRDRIQQHMAGCEHGKEVCECSMVLKRRDIEEHRRQSCPRAPVACEHCGQRIERRAMHSHWREECRASVPVMQFTALADRVETLEQQLQESIHREAAAAAERRVAAEEASKREAAAAQRESVAAGRAAALLEMLQGKAEKQSMEQLQQKVESLELQLQRQTSNAYGQPSCSNSRFPPSMSAPRSVSRLREQVAASQGSKHWTAFLPFRTKEWEARKWAAKWGADFDAGVRVSLCCPNEQSGDVHYEVIMTTRPLGVNFDYDEVKHWSKIIDVDVGGQAEALGIAPGHFLLALNDSGVPAAPGDASQIFKRETGHLRPVYTERQRVFTVRGKDDNRDAWYIVLVKNDSMDEFKQHMESPAEKIHLKELGEVLESGYGTSPPDHVDNKIKRRFSIPLDSDL